MSNLAIVYARTARSALFVLALLVAGPVCAATYYVSPSGNNANTGTSTSAPFRTIQYAMDRVVAGDTVVLRGGTYREQVESIRGGTLDKPVYLVAHPGEIPVIKGSDIVTGWVQDSGAVWKKSGWPHNSQQVFVDFDLRPGKSLQQIGMPSKFYTSWEYPKPIGSGRSSMVPGSFYYDPAAQTLYVQLADGSDPNAHVIEASVRRRLLMMHQPSIHVRGIRFRHTSLSAFAQQGAAVEMSANSVIEQCDIQYTDFAGLGMGYMQSGAQAYDCIVSNNGSSGVNAASSANFRVRAVTMTHNNNRNFNVYWHAGGFKGATNAWGTIEDSEIAYNNGPGVWFDYANAGSPIVIRNNHVHDNSAGEAGIFIEVSNNSLVYNNVVVRNRVRGIYVAAGNNNQVYNNTIYGTVERAGIEVAGMPRGTATLKNNLVHNNIVSHGTTRYDLFLAAPNGTTIAENVSDYNVFFRPLAASILSLAGTNYTSLAAWTSASGQDARSLTGDPRFTSAGASPLGYAVMAGSPAIDAGLNLAATVPDDYSKVLRPVGNGLDIGAFEVAAPATAPPTAPPAPSVDITAPVVTLSSAVGAAAKHITLSATATDDVGVAAMEMFVDGKLRASSTNGEISYRWHNPKPGSHEIRIVATDAARNEGSATANLTIK